MAELYANSPVAGSSTPVSLALLTEALTAGQATIKVSAAAPAALQGGEFRIVIDHEIILVTAEQNTLTWTVTRGVENTAAEAHTAGTGVFHYLTAEALAKIIREGAEAIEQVDADFAVTGSTSLHGTVTYNREAADFTGFDINYASTSGEANARCVRILAKFTGAANGAAGLNIQVTHAPSANTSASYGTVSISKAAPPEGVTVTATYGGYYRVDTPATGKGTINAIIAFLAATPIIEGVVPGTTKGCAIQNQGAAGVTTSVGIDIEAQTGATKTIGLRAAKAATYTILLTDAGGTLAGGITFAEDISLWRSAAKKLKVNGTLEAEKLESSGELIAKGASSFTGTVTVNTEGNPAICFLMQPTVNQAETNAQAMAIKPKFTGSGTQPAAMLVLATSEPSASISTAYGTRNIIEANPAEGVTITTAIGAAYRFQTGATSKGSVTEGRAFYVEAPTLSGIKPTTLVGLFVSNQGAAGITTSVGVDVKEQSASTTSIGVRIAKGGTYALQLSDTGGTAAGGITFGTDTQLWRVSAKVLKTEGRIEALEGVVPTVTALPAEPKEGQEVDFQSATMAEAGVRWRLKYNGKSASTHKWEFVGGSSFTAVGVESSKAAVLANSWNSIGGPKLTLPLAGDYEIRHESTLINENSGVNVNPILVAGISVAGAEPFTTSRAQSSPPSAPNVRATTYWTCLLAGVAANTTIEQKYFSSLAETLTLSRAGLFVVPIRVG